MGYLQNVILADCVSKTPSGLSNYFIYVDVNNPEYAVRVANNMYVNYTKITSRKIAYYGGDQKLLFRAYFSWGVDEKHNNDTYIEVISLTDHLNPRTVKIIDKKFLTSQKIQFVDFELYFDRIITTESNHGLIDLKIGQLLSSDKMTFKSSPINEDKGYWRGSSYSQYANTNSSEIYATHT